MVVNRAFDPVHFTVHRTAKGIEIVTDGVHLSYDEALQRRRPVRPSRRRHGPPPHLALRRAPVAVDGRRRQPGRRSTLDEVDGRTDLDDGVLSFNGSAMLDDSHTMALTADGWIGARLPGNIDVYLFARRRLPSRP